MSDGGGVRRMLLTNVGELVTNDPAPDRDGGPLGIVRDAAVLVEDGRVAWVGPAAHVDRSSSSDAGGDAYRDHATGLDTAAALPIRPTDAAALPTRPALSAGVFLAYPTLLAVQPAPDAALRALLDANPEADRFGPDAVREMYEQYLGGPVEDAPLPAVPGRAAASDLMGFPPVLMINDEADELRISGEAFAATLLEARVPVDLVVEPGTDHGHLNRPDEPAASASIERVVRWIAWLATHHRTTLRITEGITP